MSEIIVVGAGLAGLAASCHLIGRGHDVLVVERESLAGGRAGREETEGFVFDTGPSVLTMPQLILSAAIGGSALTDVLCAGAHSGCDPEGPDGAVVVPDATRRRAVDRLLNG